MGKKRRMTFVETLGKAIQGVHAIKYINISNRKTMDKKRKIQANTKTEFIFCTSD